MYRVDSHQSFYSEDVHVKQKFCYLQHFSRRPSNHVMYVTIICVTKFKPEFRKKYENVTNFINGKGRKANTYRNLLVGYIS